MLKEFYSYDMFKDDCNYLIPKLKQCDFDTIIPIARGGLTFGHFISSALDIRKVYPISSIHYDGTTKLDNFIISNIPDLSNSSNILIVDDIIDSGETIVEILTILKNKYPNCTFKVASIYYKKTALIMPHFYAKEAINWIEFFWE